MTQIPDTAITAAAKSAYEDAFLKHAPDYAPRWDDIPEAHESWREIVRAVAAVALPHLGRQEWAIQVYRWAHDRWVIPAHHDYLYPGGLAVFSREGVAIDYLNKYYPAGTSTAGWKETRARIVTRWRTDWTPAGEPETTDGNLHREPPA